MPVRLVQNYPLAEFEVQLSLCRAISTSLWIAVLVFSKIEFTGYGCSFQNLSSAYITKIHERNCSDINYIVTVLITEIVIHNCDFASWSGPVIKDEIFTLFTTGASFSVYKVNTVSLVPHDDSQRVKDWFQ